MKLMKNLTCIFFVLMILIEAVIAEPKITNDQVVFHNNIKINYSKSDQLPLINASKFKWLPLSFSETPVLIEKWKRLYMVRLKYFYEGVTTELSCYNYSGELLGPTLGFEGEVKYLTQKRTTLVFQKSSHRILDRSYITDTDCKVLSVIKHGQVSRIEISEDQELIVFIRNYVVMGNPVFALLVTDYLGAIVSEHNEFSETKLTIKYKNKEYEFEVGVPKFPG